MKAKKQKQRIESKEKNKRSFTKDDFEIVLKAVTQPLNKGKNGQEPNRT